MNLYYTGLGIARSLGTRGVRVIGLTAHRGIYGNFTRYARVVSAPDSRTEPERLLPCLVRMGQELGERAVLFPTRDDDLVFLDRFRADLEPYYNFVMPESQVLNACLDKFETSLAAKRAKIPAPKCWVLEGPEDLQRLAGEVTYPCVLKPISSHQWRQKSNWELVGARKAIGIFSEVELRTEYETIARAEKRVLLQEQVPGSDECLRIAACYMDRNSRYVAGFQAQKVVQVPEAFGTGCIVQSIHCPALVGPTVRVLESIGFTGLAEVEYKWDEANGEYKLIEINPRPWDQHRLGPRCGVDLIYLAYSEHAGLPLPPATPPRLEPAPEYKWIAEDVFVSTVLQMAWRRDPRLRSLVRNASGKRVFAIWSMHDPLPFIGYFFGRYIPDFMAACFRRIFLGWKRNAQRKLSAPKRGLVYERHQEN